MCYLTIHNISILFNFTIKILILNKDENNIMFNYWYTSFICFSYNHHNKTQQFINQCINKYRSLFILSNNKFYYTPLFYPSILVSCSTNYCEYSCAYTDNVIDSSYRIYTLYIIYRYDIGDFIFIVDGK